MALHDASVTPGFPESKSSVVPDWQRNGRFGSTEPHLILIPAPRKLNPQADFVTPVTAATVEVIETTSVAQLETQEPASPPLPWAVRLRNRAKRIP